MGLKLDSPIPNICRILPVSVRIWFLLIALVSQIFISTFIMSNVGVGGVTESRISNRVIARDGTREVRDESFGITRSKLKATIRLWIEI